MKLKEESMKFANGELSKPEYINSMYNIHQVLFDYADFIKNTDIARVEITDGLVVMTTRQSGVKMICNPLDKRIIPIEILNFEKYEEEALSMILKMITPKATVFDVGANIGWYTLNLAMLVKDIKIHAFEPIPQTFSYLKRNIQLNDFEGIKLYNFGFSNEEKEVDFYFYPEGSGNASIAKLTDTDNLQTVTCKVKRLDDFVKGLSNITVDFLKCDVEGAELLVFQGAKETIARDKPIIFTEMLRKWSAQFGYHPNQIIEFFKTIGYRCFIIKESILEEFFQMDNATNETNFFFLHSIVHKDMIDKLTFRR